MKAKVHKELIALAIYFGIKTVSEYAKFCKKLKQIAKEVKRWLAKHYFT